MLDDSSSTCSRVAYGGGGPFPLPMQFFDSDQADQKASTNITGFKDKRADEIIELYDRELDVKKRAALLRELDGIVAAQHHYILEWSAPYQRMVYWNKFGQPKGTITRIGDYRDPPWLWWFDPQKTSELEEALRDPSKKLEVGEPDDKYWLEFAKIEETETRSTSDGLLSSSAAADHSDVPRHHAGRVRRHALRARRARRAADHALQDGRWRRKAEAAAARPVRHGNPSRSHRGDEAVLRLRQAGSHPLRHVALERPPSRSRQRPTSIRIPSGTSSSRAFRSRSFSG